MSLSLFRRGERQEPQDVGTVGLSLWEPGQQQDRFWEKWTERERATLTLFGDGLGRIPDEAAVQLGRDFMAIRPACAILHKRGELRETGVRRKARAGMAKELVITEKGREVLRLMGGKP